jgi:hypothetical protein
LIHLVAKVFAKVLSLRLAPKLDNLVSKSQNAFIGLEACTTTSSSCVRACAYSTSFGLRGFY